MAFKKVTQVEMAIISTKINNLKDLHGKSKEVNLMSFDYDLTQLSRALDDAFVAYARIIDRNNEYNNGKTPPDGVSII